MIFPYVDEEGDLNGPRTSRHSELSEGDHPIETEIVKTDAIVSCMSRRRYSLLPLTELEKTATSELVYRMWTVIHPQSKAKRIWDVILITLLLYTATIMPYRVALIDGNTFDDWWWCDNVLNILFFIDFLLTCFTAYYNEFDELVFQHRLIWVHYLKGWLVIDLVACIPLDLLLESGSGSSGSYNNLLRLFRLPRLYRLIRISKLFKLIQQYRNSELLMKIQDFFNIKQSVARLVGVFLSVLVCVHIFACLWVLIPKLENYELRTWIVKSGFTDSSLYIKSLYWCFVTFSTVGYGDITPGTDIEMFTSVLWMVFAVCFYSFIIGSLVSILSSIETK
jgi:hypothetical protein